MGAKARKEKEDDHGRVHFIIIITIFASGNYIRQLYCFSKYNQTRQMMNKEVSDISSNLKFRGDRQMFGGV